MSLRFPNKQEEGRKLFVIRSDVIRNDSCDAEKPVASHAQQLVANLKDEAVAVGEHGLQRC